MPIEVFLADDQEMVRTGFRLIVNNEEDLVVVGEASDGAEAIRSIKRLKPDVVLMDIQMPELDGLAATKQLLEAGCESSILILTTFERDDYIFEALRIGASGFLLKNSPPEELLDAIRVVSDGDALLSPSVTKRVIKTFARRSAVAAPSKALDVLTERELDVFAQMAKGLSNSEIAAELLVGEATVKTHVSAVLAKLQLRDRVQAVVFAYENGITGRD